MNPTKALVIHNNCTGGCRFCFVEPYRRDDAEETASLLDETKRLGIDSRLFHLGRIDEELSRRHPQPEEMQCFGNRGRDGYSNPAEVSFNLHGPSAQVHELLAPRGEFDAILEEIGNHRDNGAGPLIQIFSVIHEKNFRLMEEMCRLFHELGADRVFFLKLSYGGRNRKLPADMFMTRDSIARFLTSYDRIRFRLKPTRFLLLHNWGPRYSHFKQLCGRLLRWFSTGAFCETGRDEVAVQASTKEIYACRFTVTVPVFRMGRFDPDRGMIIDNDWFPTLHENVEEPCRSCRVFHSCQGGCRSEAVSEKYRLTGEMDVNAGFDNCMVSAGSVRLINWREDSISVLRVLGKLFPFFR